ncbi:MAG: Ppx/GppA family phosphatase [Pseudorhodoplanes sp.]|nr:Guanosine-5'-triphosphate,3'-diphosphate pyrophosphatase [Pseudorhodoplanes sp.]MBW7950263.1 Ppx/GppA family phosphatase [Pseudorhodoplanes sp.]MCL4712582.1 Ppx/GppA family phosphatase [Pseudorhodoplanes sp.]MCQ3942603.1 Ppx/GppA family phosphatase [Alphaproteobacteria bacterium]GIK79092.1 MAG: exopolyphosphatase [Alphaproteobacteria bacterium]
MDDEARATGLDPARERAFREPRAEIRATRDRGAPLHPRLDGGGHGTDLYGPTYAALDLGTNNCRLLVARATHDGFRVIDAFSRIIRLGEGITASGRLGEPAIERAVEALKICRDKMRNRGVTRARLIATEACRRAENGVAFLSRVRDQVGLDLEVVDRETEALLAATGCTPLIDPQADGAVLFDIGGGSSEIVRLGHPEAARHGPPAPAMRDWISLPVGVVTLAERHGGIVVTPDIFEAMIAEVAGHIAPFAAAQSGHDPLRVHLLGTSGTVTTIAGVHLALRRYDRRRVDGSWMSDSEITGVMRRLLAMSYDERAANPCIGFERADLVLAGCAILEAIRRTFPCTRLRIADRGLREGMLVQMMRDDRIWAEGHSQ